MAIAVEPALSPHLVVDDAAAAIDFYVKAFGAQEIGRVPRPDGKLVHAAVRINGFLVMLNDDFPEMSGGKSMTPTSLGGTPVTIQNVKTVETGEEQIKALGFRQFRVRFHGEVVRIEIAPDELERALTLDMAHRFTAIFKSLGFKYVALDLEGYRQGSLNEVLNLQR